MSWRTGKSTGEIAHIRPLIHCPPPVETDAHDDALPAFVGARPVRITSLSRQEWALAYRLLQE